MVNKWSNGGRDGAPGGLSTPGRGQGEGPVDFWIFGRILLRANVQKAMGGAGVKRSGTESPGGAIPSSPSHPCRQYTKSLF